jgi:hypothetical protein
MAAFFTRKSHAAIYLASNYLICKQSLHASDIFDSHHPLQFQPILANASQCSAGRVARSSLADVGLRWLWVHTQDTSCLSYLYAMSALATPI